ncbi:hypothetical protein OEZ85_013025 [Tetradesmus obliquus]|uniref:Uncharacterized protein n=1 Tax=Tetradesmus obliquus TaxID=3088 RepID=A0ABY8U7B3_TETOB|nr:hypothetical protein OEZ85_013025 [Tetradesmus obliquus]
MPWQATVELSGGHNGDLLRTRDWVVTWSSTQLARLPPHHKPPATTGRLAQISDCRQAQQAAQQLELGWHA